ncbi:hypothetical protein VTN96DRAFT_3870 [Rasamsonia emersonii]
MLDDLLRRLGIPRVSEDLTTPLDHCAPELVVADQGVLPLLANLVAKSRFFQLSPHGRHQGNIAPAVRATQFLKHLQVRERGALHAHVDNPVEVDQAGELDARLVDTDQERDKGFQDLDIRATGIVKSGRVDQSNGEAIRGPIGIASNIGGI